MYWIPNNFISLAQTRALKTAPMKKYFNIPEPPPVDPFAKKEEGAMEKLQNVRYFCFFALHCIFLYCYNNFLLRLASAICFYSMYDAVYS
jgi:hypothetical protein